MKTILWAALTANGNYALSSAEHPPKPEALADYAAYARKAGNFIVGRRTFEAFNAGGGGNTGGGNPFADLDIVVVSSSDLDFPGVTQVSTPQEALDYLRGRGHETALLVGGESLHNAFLAQNLVDELVFNMIPTLEGKGMNVVLGEGQYQEAQLQEVKEIGAGIVQLRYALPR